MLSLHRFYCCSNLCDSQIQILEKFYLALSIFSADVWQSKYGLRNKSLNFNHHNQLSSRKFESSAFLHYNVRFSVENYKFHLIYGSKHKENLANFNALLESL